MTTINPETQIVASAYDELNRICSYTYEHTDGSRYTVKVPMSDLEKIGLGRATVDQRRRHIAQTIISHVQANPPDEQQ